jgi:hypothetical protein
LKNTLLFLKLGLVAAWLVLILACGQMKKNAENATNVTAGNINPSANSSANNTAVTAANKRDPKTVCAYLPDFKTAEYKVIFDDVYMCNGTYFAPPTKDSAFVYGFAATGKAENVETVQITIQTNPKDKSAAQGDEGVVEWSEKLWQKVFAAPLPEEIKAALLTNQGKRIETTKKFTEPAEVTVLRKPEVAGVYTLKFELTLPK